MGGPLLKGKFFVSEGFWRKLNIIFDESSILSPTIEDKGLE